MNGDNEAILYIIINLNSTSIRFPCLLKNKQAFAKLNIEFTNGPNVTWPLETYI